MSTSRLLRQCRRALGRGLAAIAVLALTGCDLGGAKASKQAPPAPVPTVIVAEIAERTVPVSAEFLIQQDEYKAALQSARAQLAKARADLTRARDVSVVDRARAQLDQAKADLGKNRADVARYRPLVQEQAIPQQDLDTSVSKEQVAAAGVEAAEAGLKDTVLSQRTAIQLGEAAVESAQAAVTQAELNLKYTVVQSPISGIISKLTVDTGNLVGKGEPTLLATVSAMHPIFVDFSIAEVDYLRLVKRVPGLGRGEVRRDRAPALELILADATVFPHKGRPVFVDRP